MYLYVRTPLPDKKGHVMLRVDRERGTPCGISM